jgi:hypothetical protein
MAAFPVPSFSFYGMMISSMCSVVLHAYRVKALGFRLTPSDLVAVPGRPRLSQSPAGRWRIAFRGSDGLSWTCGWVSLEWCAAATRQRESGRPALHGLRPLSKAPDASTLYRTSIPDPFATRRELPRPGSGSGTEANPPSRFRRRTPTRCKWQYTPTTLRREASPSPARTGLASRGCSCPS